MAVTDEGERMSVPTNRADIDDAVVPLVAARGDRLSRRQRAEAVVALAGSRREPLDRIRANFQAQLHASSDDLDATEGLRTVEIALRLMPPTAQDDRVRRAQR